MMDDEEGMYGRWIPRGDLYNIVFMSLAFLLQPGVFPCFFQATSTRQHT